MDDEAAVRFWQARFDYWQAEFTALPRWAWLRRRRLERHIDLTQAYIEWFSAEAQAVADANR